MSFKEIIGQQVAKEILKRSLEKDRIASAYLFSGPEGVGKALTALNFAKALNCKRHKTDSCSSLDGDYRCSSCKKIDAFSHPDVKFFFPAPQKSRNDKTRNELLLKGEVHRYQKTEVISIEDIREIAELLLLKPFEAKRRVIIIIDAEAMNVEAQNSFLKILEEPPKDTTIILTSSHPDKLFSTIVSRCLRIGFRRLSANEVKQYLSKRYDISYEKIELISRLSNGSITRADSFLNGESLEQRELLKSILLEKDFMKLQEIVDKDTLKEFIDFTLFLFKDLNSKRVGQEILNIDLEDNVRTLSKFYNLKEIKEMVKILEESMANITRNVNPELIANVIFDKFKDVSN